MVIETFPVGPLGCNCSIVVDEKTGTAIVIDPGGEFEKIRERLEKNGARPTAIVHTHTHIDHVGATAPLQRWSSAGAHIHEADRALYDILHVQAQLLRIPMPERCELEGDLTDDTVLSAGDVQVAVLHTPGHTPGSVSFYLEHGGERVAFLGPSGSGKSTLLALLGGIQKPSAGRVFLGEEEISRMGERYLARIRSRQVSTLLQGATRNLLAYATARQNIAFARLSLSAGERA